MLKRGRTRQVPENRPQTCTTLQQSFLEHLLMSVRLSIDPEPMVLAPATSKPKEESVGILPTDCEHLTAVYLLVPSKNGS